MAKAGPTGKPDKEERDKKNDEDEDAGESGFLSDRMSKMGLRGDKKSKDDLPYPSGIKDNLTLQGICECIKRGECKKIVTITGAGISTSAGIPDFRSPESGLYAKLSKDERFKVPRDNPMAIFDINFFQATPEPFFLLAKELYPDPNRFKPTRCHHFIRLLQDKNLLLRHYTENVDNLERAAGIADDMMVEAHGSFHKSHCLNCRAEYSVEDLRDSVVERVEVPHCTKKRSTGEKAGQECGGIIKPDIVFFGEQLPERFSKLASQDFKEADLLIIMGTSLVVQPFDSLTDRVADHVPRLYVNLDEPTSGGDLLTGFEFGQEGNKRDVFHKSTCDDGCDEMSKLLGWKAELDKLCQTEHTPKRLNELLQMASGYDKHGGGFRKCVYMYRHKPKDYYDEILSREGPKQGMMIPYVKDSTGDLASPINGKLDGLFFSVNVNVFTGEPMKNSIFGDYRLLLPCIEFLSASNLYFADFYCTQKSSNHYVTLVMTKSGTEADAFCQQKLVALDRNENPFLFIGNTTVMVTTKLYVEVFYTESVDIRGRPLDCITKDPIHLSRSHGLPKNQKCSMCNLPDQHQVLPQ